MIDFLPPLPLGYRWKYEKEPLTGTPTLYLEKSYTLHYGFLRKKKKLAWEEVASRAVFPDIWNGVEPALSQSARKIMEIQWAKIESNKYYGIYEPLDTRPVLR